MSHYPVVWHGRRRRADSLIRCLTVDLWFYPPPQKKKILWRHARLFVKSPAIFCPQSSSKYCSGRSPRILNHWRSSPRAWTISAIWRHTDTEYRSIIVIVGSSLISLLLFFSNVTTGRIQTKLLGAWPPYFVFTNTSIQYEREYTQYSISLYDQISLKNSGTGPYGTCALRSHYKTSYADDTCPCYVEWQTVFSGFCYSVRLLCEMWFNKLL